MPHKCLFDKVANAQPPVSEDIAKTLYIVEAITGQIVWEPQSDGDRIMSSKASEIGCAVCCLHCAPLCCVLVVPCVMCFVLVALSTLN